jgi:hypothetical protein
MMIEAERDVLSKFLRDLQQTRLPTQDEQAAGMVAETLKTHPQGAYLLALRCVLLEKQLAAAQSSDSHSVESFLQMSEHDWRVNAQPLRQPFIAGNNSGNKNIPTHLLMEEKAINFLGNNAMAVWAFILVVTAAVVYFKRA